MSRKVTVDYQGVSIQVQAQCDTAIHSLCRIDKVLNRIHETAYKLEDEKVKQYEAYLNESKIKIQEKIENFKKTLDKYKDARQYSVYNERPEYNEFVKFSNQVKTEAKELIDLANELTGSKLAVIDQMINDGLLNAGNEVINNLKNKINGVVNINEKLLKQINEIEDISLRELAYRIALKENSNEIAFDNILSKAQDEYDILLGKKTKEVIEEYKEDLKTKGIDATILEKANSITEATNITSELIIDEQVRKETLKIIIKAIKDRGFIVDTKKNLKIDKQRNIVKLVALKASGQRAEFEIQLNGKFMYHFDEYEGHACKKDIAPFLEDLKNIYDINITHEEVAWENPDKIQTQKYQYINKNKGTN